MTPPKKHESRSTAARLKRLFRQRTTILGSAALVRKFDEQYQDGQIHQLKVRIESLDQLWAEFARVQDEIEELECHVDFDEEDDDVEPTLSEQRIRFQNLYFELKASLISKLPAPGASATVASTPQDHRPPVQPTHSVRLPEINIPEFCGNPSNWIVFRDIFRSMIHMNVQLSSVQKMHYLKAALKGDAARIVANLGVNSGNYPIAWKSVCERYDNPNLLRKHHFATLFAIPCVKRASSSSLYNLVDEFDHQVGILEKLDDPASLWDTVLVETLSKRLDTATLKEWENSCEVEERPTYKNLVDFVRKASRVLQSVTLLQSPSQSSEAKPTKPKPISTHIVTETTSKCSLCKQAHPLYKCDQHGDEATF
ncbi:uncharacterized protein LOC129782116 [Toxorhynchites rutilus septentrionalis]|uniref:uncharacterized protein LOC129782116 n=1 Tax=Toxorhynchites rutilus septentrionalis TaxID=329112 RepID=UPI00247A6298|nr:uncharacterized protein LOC129782116 [Toxorhynchites rutilus septentrionalis]